MIGVMYPWDTRKATTRVFLTEPRGAVADIKQFHKLFTEKLVVFLENCHPYIYSSEAR